MLEAFRRIGPAAGGRPVVLVAQAPYHLEELIPLRDELAASGIEAELVVPVPARRSLGYLRPGVRRHRLLIKASPEPVSSPVDVSTVVDGLRALVVMNDWGTTAALVDEVTRLGRPTFGWVEGVQDFADVDTGLARRPYRRVGEVFCLGTYDSECLAECRTTVVGSQRLQRLWSSSAPLRPDRAHATVNSNFTYGVLTHERRRWLRSVRQACTAAAIDSTVSHHPAERRLALPRGETSVEELLERSTHLVSRFSTVCYEALVRGVELVYHNPHRERVPTFSEPCGAYELTRSTAELARALLRDRRDPDQVRAAAGEFLRRHLRLDPEPPPAKLAAGRIRSRLG